MDDLEGRPLTLSGKAMPQQNAAKYLDDYLSASGLSDSVKVTVMKRKPQVTRAIYEIRAVIDDCRSQIVGGLTAGFQLWDMAVLPMLLFNAECWLEIDNTTINILEQLQYTFLRNLCSVGSGCPLPLLLSETGMTLMELRIMRKKLMFLHHLSCLGNDSLAHEVLTIQADLSLPGLYSECHSFLVQNQISDIRVFSKAQWKKLVKTKIDELNKAKLVEMTIKKSYKKINLNALKEDDCSLKPYFMKLKVEDARLRFKMASNMTPTVAMNFQSERKFIARLWSCPSCFVDEDKNARDTQQHILICKAYANLRIGRDLTNDKDLVDYMRNVINLRLLL